MSLSGSPKLAMDGVLHKTQSKRGIPILGSEKIEFPAWKSGQKTVMLKPNPRINPETGVPLTTMAKREVIQRLLEGRGKGEARERPSWRRNPHHLKRRLLGKREKGRVKRPPEGHLGIKKHQRTWWWRRRLGEKKQRKEIKERSYPYFQN